MSKFPTPETFKNHKTKPQELVQRFLPTLGYVLNENIFPRKFKKCYIYDIIDQKFCDFFLNYGRLYLGFSDKYLTKMLKNYVKTTVFSYSSGVFTYRFFKLLDDVCKNKFSQIFVVRDETNLANIVKSIVNSRVIVNTEYLHNIFEDSVISRECNVLEPFDDSFSLVELPKDFDVLFLGRGIRYPEVFEILENNPAKAVVLGIGNLFVVMTNSLNSFGNTMNLSEFEAMFGYYYLLRERFLITKKLYRLKNYTQRWLGKFIELGIGNKLTPYCIELNKDYLPGDFNLLLLKEGIFSYGTRLFFSFQHEEPDFKRLRRKLNQVLEINYL